MRGPHFLWAIFIVSILAGHFFRRVRTSLLALFLLTPIAFNEGWNFIQNWPFERSVRAAGALDWLSCESWKENVRVISLLCVRFSVRALQTTLWPDAVTSSVLEAKRNPHHAPLTELSKASSLPSLYWWVQLYFFFGPWVYVSGVWPQLVAGVSGIPVGPGPCMASRSSVEVGRCPRTPGKVFAITQNSLNDFFLDQRTVN